LNSRGNQDEEEDFTMSEIEIMKKANSKHRKSQHKRRNDNQQENLDSMDQLFAKSIGSPSL
jgi:hypothetical protein